MFYRLATLLILAALIGAALVGIGFYSPRTAIVVVCIGILIALLPAALLILILWRELGEAEQEMHEGRLVASLPPSGSEDETGKRPGQFGISTLFVLMTVAAVACAIVRLPMAPVGRFVALLAVWVCFSVWAMGKPDQRQWASLAYRRRLAVLHAMGSLLFLTPMVWLRFQRGPRTASFLFAELAFGAVMLLSPAHAIWQAGKAIRAELNQARLQKHNKS
jgi:hypothetical protein